MHVLELDCGLFGHVVECLAMQKWEYKILPIATVVLKELYQTLAQLGQDEWELTTSIPGEVLPGGMGTFLVFKRAVPNHP